MKMRLQPRENKHTPIGKYNPPTNMRHLLLPTIMPIEMRMLTSASAADIRSSMVDACRAREGGRWFETFPTATRALKMRDRLPIIVMKDDTSSNRRRHYDHHVCLTAATVIVVLVTSFQQSLPCHRQQYRRRRTVSLLWAQKFHLGEEEVMVMDDNGTSCFTGMIEQKKGGWYTVRNVRDSTKWMKRRASHLQKRTVLDTEEGTQPRYNSQNSTNPTLSSLSSSATSASSNLIIDLDSIILQSSRMGYSSTTDQQSLNNTINDKNQTIIPLETIHQVTSCHSQYNRWLLFSDLHVMPSTLSTCITVLNTVHTIAIKYNSGIIFLGDLWHHRGFVQVNCLNAILAAMANWKVPIIMIPGNHDQVDYRGLEHALTPLCNAYRIHSPNTNNDCLDHNTDSTTFTAKLQQQYNGPLILSHPTKFMNALFIPHIRDKELMKSILCSTEAITSSALFVHADVKGASMNDLITSRYGLSESIFPTNKYIYSGHFHKPHEIQIGKKKSLKSSSSSTSSSSSIRYVGSPYQTSLSESGQIKSLLLVDSNNGWQCIDEIPIDVGPRYHRISSLHHFLDCSSIGQGDIQSGDKVVVTVDPQELEEMHINTDKEEFMTTVNKRSLFNDKLDEFRQSGISVEIRDIQSQQPEDVDVLSSSSSSSSSLNEDKIEFEDQSPMTTFITYLSSEVNRSGELGEATVKKLTSYGEELLREANDGGTRRGGGLVTPGITTGVCEIEIESVSILGFGSFRQEVLYPLTNRGVVLLKGTNNDDIGSDSNGVGKSTLAMSALWSLSGSLDARPTQDGKVADIVNDSSMNAEVTLRGFINSKPFLLKRTKSTSAKDSSLIFILDGENLTQQSIQGTQQLIDQHFNIGTLMRTVFHGQHSIGGLLESSDAKFKEELSYLVSLEIWQQTASLARLKHRDHSRKIAEIDGMLAIREKDNLRAHAKVMAAEEEMTKRKEILENERTILSQKDKYVPHKSSVNDIEAAMELVQSQLNDCQSKIDQLELELSSTTKSNNDDIMKLRSQLNEKVSIEYESKLNLQACEREYEIATLELKSSNSRLDHLENEWKLGKSLKEDTSISSFLLPENCHTCGQPISSTEAREHVRESINEMLVTAIRQKDESNEKACSTKQAIAKAKEEREKITLEVQSITKILRLAEDKRVLEIDDVLNRIKETRTNQSRLSHDFATIAKKVNEASGYDLHISRMQTSLNRLEVAFDASVTAYNDCIIDNESIQSNIVDLKKEKEVALDAMYHYGLLGDMFGPKGVQAFVLRNVIQALQICSQSYLDDLSNGSLHLRVQVGTNDSILKQAAVRNLDGTWRYRPLSSLSGGQWRRCSLALSLGYVDLASKRGKMRSSLLVLDEPLTHLDSAGRKCVGKLLRKMVWPEPNARQIGRGSSFNSLTTILVILQEIAAEEIEDCFNEIDEVIKLGGESFVVLDENREELLNSYYS